MAKKTFYELIGEKVRQINKNFSINRKGINIAPIDNDKPASERTRAVIDEVKEINPELTKTTTKFIDENKQTRNKGEALEVKNVNIKNTDINISNIKKRKKSDKKDYYPAGEDIIIDNITDILVNKIDEPYSSFLLNALESAIADEGKENVAERLNKHSIEIYDGLHVLSVGSENARKMISANLYSIIRGGALTKEEAKEVDDVISDSYEYDEEIEF